MNLWIHLLFSLAATTLIFCIDEGYYDFRWTLKAGNWVAFMIYGSFFFLIQKAVQFILLKNMKGIFGIVLSGFLGSLFLVLTLMILFSR